MNYKRYFTLLMALSEGLAMALILAMFWWKENLTVLMLCGFLAVIFTIIAMSLHIIVRLEEHKKGENLGD